MSPGIVLMGIDFQDRKDLWQVVGYLTAMHWGPAYSIFAEQPNLSGKHCHGIRVTEHVVLQDDDVIGASPSSALE